MCGEGSDWAARAWEGSKKDTLTVPTVPIGTPMWKAKVSSRAFPKDTWALALLHSISLTRPLVFNWVKLNVLPLWATRSKV